MTCGAKLALTRDFEGAAKMTPEDKQILLDAARAMGHPDPKVVEGEWLETRYLNIPRQFFDALDLYWRQ